MPLAFPNENHIKLKKQPAGFLCCFQAFPSKKKFKTKIELGFYATLELFPAKKMKQKIKINNKEQCLILKGRK